MKHLLEGFKSYLEANRVSKKTQVNYLSDLSNFLTWALRALKENGEVPNGTRLVANFSTQLLEQYKQSLIEEEIPVGTINRRLSALRQLGRFLAFYKLITKSPAENLENLPRSFNSDNPLISDYINSLRQSGADDKEIKKTRETLNEFLRITGLSAQAGAPAQTS